MDNKKFETLIDLIINENEDQARQLFHEIIVEKSREIYESIMEEEMMDETMHGGMEEVDEMVGEVGDLMDEITSEESGMYEDEEEDMDSMDIEDEEEIELEPSDDMDGEEDIEDRVVDLEDKVDELERLMAEFEAEMGGDDMEEMGDEEEEDVAMMENVNLSKVSVTHGDNGANPKSPNLNDSGQAGMDSHPVKFSGAAESVPTGPKGPSNAYSKSETSVKGAGNFKNVPGKDNFKDKGESTPKPVSKDDSAYKHSPVAKG
jgi:hypothetical protein